MKRASLAGLALAVFGGALLAGAPAKADGHMTVQGGAFVPWQGDPGYSFLLQLLGSNASAKARFGAEFEFRNYDSNIMGVSDVAVESYAVRAVWQQHFRPDGSVSPYIGLGLGFTINDVNDGKVDRARGQNVRRSIGAGPDGVFMLGLQARVPGADYLSLYVEGRVGFAYDFTDRRDKTQLQVENLGGATGSAGLRFRF